MQKCVNVNDALVLGAAEEYEAARPVSVNLMHFLKKIGVWVGLSGCRTDAVGDGVQRQRRSGRKGARLPLCLTFRRRCR